MDLSDYPADKLAGLYLKIRDKRDALTREYEEKHKELQTMLSTITLASSEVSSEK